MVYSAAWMGAALLNLRLMYYSAWILGEQSFLLGGFGTTASNGFELEQVQAIEPFEVEVLSSAGHYLRWDTVCISMT